MAGSYPDPPGPRIAWDRDGTVAVWLTNDGMQNGTLTLAQRQALADEGLSGGPTMGGHRLALLFPSPRDLVGIYFFVNNTGGMPGAGTPSAGFRVRTSSDSTNGIDGTWVGSNPYGNTVYPYQPNPQTRTGMRDNIGTISQTNVKAITIGDAFSGQIMQSVHLYGTPTTTADRLVFWHPTLDQPLGATPAALDWGNRPRSTFETRQVRLKNTSPSVTASTITVGREALTDTSPTIVSAHQLSLDNVTFTDTVSIGALAPGEISNVIYVRQTLSNTAVMGLWSARLYASAAGWA